MLHYIKKRTMNSRLEQMLNHCGNKGNFRCCETKTRRVECKTRRNELFHKFLNKTADSIAVVAVKKYCLKSIQISVPRDLGVRSLLILHKEVRSKQ